MTITRVTGRHRTEAVTSESFAAHRAPYAKVSVDVGTGDGRFAYQLASADPDRLVLGIDALAEPMEERAVTSARTAMGTSSVRVHSTANSTMRSMRRAASGIRRRAASTT